MTVFRAHISVSPGIEPVEMLYLGPVRRAAYGGTRPAVWPLMMVPGVRTGPRIERGAQAGIEPAVAAWVTQHIGSAKAVRNRSTPVHSSAGTSP